MPAADPRLILPEPPDALKALSRDLVARMRERHQQAGRLSFSDYMEMALYEPGLGYYSAGLPKLGEDGDFVTAPELGTLFARCLARQLSDIAGALDTGAEHKGLNEEGAGQGEHSKGELDSGWVLLELGAGTGRLAADLLNALLEADAPMPGRYLILERSADLRAEQERVIRARAPAHAQRVAWLDAPPVAPWRGVLIANEVIDGDTPGWTTWPANQTLSERVTALQERLPEPLSTDGYRSELCLTLPGWLDTVTNKLTQGAALFIDYGYPRPVYYHPERRDGTLVCHYRHRGHFDPFFWPGLQDLSAFVDFTALAEAADQAGLEVTGYTPQNQFL
ncbi:MAG: SAM-dependent methyltransferase, partial [Pseudomonadota bacterium]